MQAAVRNLEAQRSLPARPHISSRRYFLVVRCCLQEPSALAANGNPDGAANTCILDGPRGLSVSWGVGAKSARMPAYVDIELAGPGEVGWLAAGFVGEARRMVTNPSHKVSAALVSCYRAGGGRHISDLQVAGGLVGYMHVLGPCQYADIFHTEGGQ
jgi:hypothetical protein